MINDPWSATMDVVEMYWKNIEIKLEISHKRKRPTSFCFFFNVPATKEQNDDRQNQHTILTKINRSDKMMFIHWIKRS